MDRFGFSAALLRAIRLMSKGRSKRCRFNRNASLAKRLIRLRSTAPPTLRLTVTPIRERPFFAGATSAMKKSIFNRRPASDKPINSERFKIRLAFFRKNRNGSATLKMVGQIGSESACQPNPSLGAATAQHFAAALGGHPFAEPVVSSPTQSAWLKWSFHKSRPG